MERTILKFVMVVLGVLLSLTVKAYDVQIDGIRYNLNAKTKTAEVARHYSYTGKLVIPESFICDMGTYEVTTISDYAFSGCSDLQSVTIPQSVTSIGSHAFYNCSGLTSLIIPNSIVSIGTGAFSGCSNLYSISFPDYISNMGSGSFAGTKWYNNQPSGIVYAGKIVYAYKGTMPESVEIKEGTLGIGVGAFRTSTGNDYNLKNVTIPSSVRKIGESAFAGCHGLSSIVIPSGVTKIDKYAFMDSGLGSITILNSGTIVGDNAFDGTPLYASVSNGICYIGNIAYRYKGTMPANTTITLESGTTGIGVYGFMNYKELVAINIPNSVSWIGDYAFCNCENITSVSIPESVTSLGFCVLGNCTKLTSIVVDDDNPIYDSRDNCNAVIETSNNALISGCSTTIIPNSVTSIEYMAFYSCKELTSVTLPSNVTSIGKQAFQYCSGLTSVISEIEVPFTFDSQAFQGISSSCVLTVPYGTKDAYIAKGWTESVFKGGIVEAPQNTPQTYTLQSKQNGYYMTLSQEGVTIGEEPYELTIEEAGNGKYYITDGTYYVGIAGTDSWSLTSNPNKKEALTIVATDVDGQVYYVLNESLGKIGVDYPYRNNFGCWADKSSGNAVLWSIEPIGENTAPFVPLITTIAIDGINYNLFSKEKIAEVTSGDSQYAGEVKIPYSVIYDGITYNVTSIGNGAFSNCNGLTSVTIPNSVTSIGYTAFSGCSGLTSVIIPNNVTSIGGYAFKGCSHLASITIPNSVTDIRYGAFANCSSLASISIPQNVTSIGGEAFAGTAWYENLEDGLIYINNIAYKYKGTMPPNSTVIINEGTISLGYQVFSDYSNLTSVTIPNSVTSINACAFQYCSNMNTITIPNSIQSIDYAAFRYAGLCSVTIPKNVTTISDFAFYGCHRLTSVFSEIEEPFVFGSDAFSNISSNCVLIVPDGKKDAYIAAGWTTGFFRGGIMEASLYDIATNNYLTTSDVEVNKGGSIVLPVDMSNTQSITATQFEVALPAGVTISKCELTNRKGEDHTASYKKLANGNYQVTVISLSKEEFSGTSGALLNLTLDVDDEKPTGIYPISLTNIELTTADTKAINPADVSATLTISDVKVADADGNGKVTITDAVAIVSHILGDDIDGFVAAAADVDGNGRITITDAVAVVDIILNGNASAKKRDFVEDMLDPQ